MKKNLFSTMLALLTIVAMLVSVGCKNYDDDISDINKKLSTAQSDITSIQSRVTTLESTVSSMQSTLTEVQTKLQNCADKSQITSLEDAQAKLQSAIDKCNAAIADNKAVLEKKIEDAAAAAAATYATITALNESNAAIAALQTTVTTLTGDVAALKAAAEKAHTEISATLTDLQSQIDAIKAQLKNYYTVEEVNALIAAIAGSSVTSVTCLDDIYAAYGYFNGAYALKSGAWVSAKWDGAKTPETGIITSANRNYVVLQVNPTTIKLTEGDVTVENQDGYVAPLVFDAPVAYEDTKATSGLWIVPFTVDPTKVEKAQQVYDQGGLWSVVVNNVRTSYDNNSLFSLEQTEKKSDMNVGYEFGSILDSDMTGSVEATTNNAEHVYDAYISKLVSINGVTPATYNQFAADSIIFGIKYGKSLELSYSKDAVAAWIAQGHSEFTVVAQVKFMTLAGYIFDDDDYVTFTVRHAAPTYETIYYEAESDTLMAIKHQMSVVEKEQVDGIDLTNFMKAMGLTAGTDEYKNFVAAKYEIQLVGTPYTVDGRGLVEFTNTVIDAASLGYMEKGDPINMLAVGFTDDYGCDYNDEDTQVENYGALYYTIQLVPRDNKYSTKVYQINDIPVSFTAPDWTKLSKFEDMKLYLNATAVAGVYGSIDIKDYFKVLGDDGEYATGSSFVIKTVDAKGTAPEYISTMVKATNETSGDAYFAPNATWMSDGYFAPYFSASTVKPTTSVTGWYAATTTYSVTDFVDANPSTVSVMKDASATYTVTGLQTTIMNRVVPVNDATIKVVKTSSENTLSLELDNVTLVKTVDTQNYWDAYNSVYEPETDTFDGDFTITDSYDKLMYLGVNARNTLSSTDDVQAYVDDAWVSTTDFDITIVNYIDENGDTRYGIKVKNNVAVPTDQSSLKVRFGVWNDSVLYVKDGSQFASSGESYLEFTVNFVDQK